MQTGRDSRSSVPAKHDAVAARPDLLDDAIAIEDEVTHLDLGDLLRGHPVLIVARLGVDRAPCYRLKE